MTELVVRRLLIDLEQPVARHWCGDDAFLTAWFNALSMSFPVGEQFFIDSVRNGFKALPADQQERFHTEVQGFVGQEATHRRIHALFNAQIGKHGLHNAWEARAQKRLALMEGIDVRHGVAWSKPPATSWTGAMSPPCVRSGMIGSGSAKSDRPGRSRARG